MSQNPSYFLLSLELGVELGRFVLQWPSSTDLTYSQPSGSRVCRLFVCEVGGERERLERSSQIRV